MAREKYLVHSMKKDVYIIGWLMFFGFIRFAMYDRALSYINNKTLFSVWTENIISRRNEKNILF